MTAMSAPSASAIDAANPFPDLPAIRRPGASPLPVRPVAPTSRRFPTPRFGDYSRTRFESRVAFGGPDEDEDAEEFIATPTRRFRLLEVTSGLPDDSREEDEKQAGRRLRDLRARVKVARAVVSSTPGLAEILAADWKKAAFFYTRFRVSEAQLRHGIPGGETTEGEVTEPLISPNDWTVERRMRESVVFPSEPE
jgi:hypothetical protein